MVIQELAEAFCTGDRLKDFERTKATATITRANETRIAVGAHEALLKRIDVAYFQTIEKSALDQIMAEVVARRKRVEESKTSADTSSVAQE
jgi:hypothetical protein